MFYNVLKHFLVIAGVMSTTLCFPLSVALAMFNFVHLHGFSKLLCKMMSKMCKINKWYIYIYIYVYAIFSSTWTEGRFKLLLTEPVFTTETAGRSFRFSAARTRNSLPDYIKASNNLRTFRNGLKTHLFTVLLFLDISLNLPTNSHYSYIWRVLHWTYLLTFIYFAYHVRQSL